MSDAPDGAAGQEAWLLTVRSQNGRTEINGTPEEDIGRRPTAAQGAYRAYISRRADP